MPSRIVVDEQDDACHACFGFTREDLFGILIGTIGLGGLSDYFDHKVMFIVEMIIFIFLHLLATGPATSGSSFFSLVWRSALERDYPTAHLIQRANRALFARCSINGWMRRRPGRRGQPFAQ